MKKYLKDLEKELRKNNLDENEIEEILADHKEMIESAINEGLTDEELNNKFGDPEAVAEELSGFTAQAKNENKENDANNEITKTLVFDNISENYDVSIALVNEDFDVQTTDSNKITVECIGKIDTDKYEIKFEKNMFSLNSPKRLKMVYFGSSKQKKFIITLPKGISVGDFKVELINGDAKIDGILSSKTSVDTKNGDIQLKNFKTGSFKFNTINGDASLEVVDCESLKVSTISGDLNVKELKVRKDVFINSVSGDLRIRNSECSELTLKTVSGDINASEFYPKQLSLRSVSGDVKIINTDASRPIQVVSKKTLSGDIDIILKKKKTK